MTEKVEGFFDVCAERELSGSQGVVIPKTNMVNLTLRPDVIRAVAEGRFNIWAVDRIEEGLELLTGVAAGEPQADGSYPEGTIFRRVVDRLEAMHALAVSAEGPRPVGQGRRYVVPGVSKSPGPSVVAAAGVPGDDQRARQGQNVTAIAAKAPSGRRPATTPWAFALVPCLTCPRPVRLVERSGGGGDNESGSRSGGMADALRSGRSVLHGRVSSNLTFGTSPCARSSVDRALGCGPKGRRFESCRAYQSSHCGGVG